MRNLIIFLSTFTLTILIVIFASAPANAGGAGGSWGCPDGWVTKPDGSCSFDGGGGSTGGSGSGGSWSDCSANYKWNSSILNKSYPSPAQACDYPGQTFVRYQLKSSTVAACFYKSNPATSGVSEKELSQAFRANNSNKDTDCTAPDKPYKPPPPFPDIPPPNPECNICQSLYEIRTKLNHIKNIDLKIINQDIYDMSQVINNIDNSITDLSVNQQITNNNITNINNSLTTLITNIENNNITNNEIKNEVTNIKNVMNDYSLQLGDIQMAMGDIAVKLDNTNKLVLSLKPDIEFIKNNLVNGSPEGKDYTEQLNQIIELLKPCEPTAEKPCPDDDEVVKKLKEMQDFMEADFVPDTDSTAVEVEDLTDIELDRNLIKFGVAQCPPDSEFSTMVNGFSFSGGFKHKPLCDFFSMLAPFVKAFGGFSAALILGGGLRRG